jgi:hypothetical protein
MQIFLLVLGVPLFAFTMYILGGDSIALLRSGFNFKYLLVYAGITIFAVCPLVWRWQVILKGYGKAVGFWSLLRIQLAGYAVSYVTPAARIGGEPLRIYMLHKEHKVDYKTGTASIVLDKYMEYLGSITFGIIALGLLVFVPSIPLTIKYVLTGLVVFSFVGLSLIYYRLVNEKGLFSNIFTLFLSKKRLKKMSKSLKDVDSKMSYFIIHHKKEFFMSYGFYLFSGILFLIEYKYLLLSFGVTSNLLDIVLITVFIGIANLIPVPMALGSLEAGQSGLFQILKNDGSIGLLLSLVHRVRGMLISAVGFLFIISFSRKDILKEGNVLN